MGREALLAALRELSDRGHGAAGFKPHYAIEQEILAEFDRLKLKVAELEGKLWDAQDEPQQPDKSLEQKIQRIFDDNTRDADCHEACIPREYYGEVILGILALLQSQQPAGELVSDYELLRLTCDTTPEKLAKRAAEAQLAHTMRSLKAQGWVKLPSEDEFPEMLRRATETALSKNKLGIVDNFDLIAQELRRLLSL